MGDEPPSGDAPVVLVRWQERERELEREAVVCGRGLGLRGIFRRSGGSSLACRGGEVLLAASFVRGHASRGAEERGKRGARRFPGCVHWCGQRGAIGG